MPHFDTRLALRLLLATILCAAGTAAAQEKGDRPAKDDLRGEPGYVDFSRQPLFDADDLEIKVSIKGTMIHLVAEASRADDPALADVLSQLEGVEVHVYKLAEEERDAVRGEITRRARELEGQGWDEAITIHLRRARGHVFLRLDDGRPVGLAAMYVGDENEAVFVNIVGAIDPAQLGRLASRFDLDLLSQAVGQDDGSD